ncbi:MAG: SusC/RagA family TonB-linked outer membrane protein, partial [bacterium]
EPDSELNNNTNLKGNWVWSNTITYDINKDDHRATLLAGNEQIKYGEEWFGASREGYLIESMDYAYLSTGSEEQLNSGLGTGWSLQSFFAKVNYSYKYKYLASLTMRRDGSSRFGKNYKYGNFPAFSLGWRIGDEPFMKNLISIPFSLKLRASWGMNGNQEINNLAIYNIYKPVYSKEDAIWDGPNPPEYMPDLGTAYDISGIDQGQLESGFITTQIRNEDLKWETTTQTNVGMDFSLFNVISGSIEYFRKQTDDILYYRMLPGAVGEASGQYVNGGSIENKGLEFMVSYTDQTGDFSYDISANASFLKNKVLDMPEDLTIRMPLAEIIPNEAKTELPVSILIGESVNSIYGYIADGIFQDEEEVLAHAEQPGKDVGRIRFRDISGPDGSPDEKVDDYDQKFIATAQPDLTYGLDLQLGYKDFSFNMFLQGIHGIEVYNGYKTYTDFTSLWPGTNFGKRTLDAWSEENKNSEIPKLTTIDSNNEGRLSTYFIENGSYFKLRNIQLGYNISMENRNNSQIRDVYVYLQGQNLFTIKSKSFTGPDPENPNYAFPIPAAYTVGLKISLQ